MNKTLLEWLKSQSQESIKVLTGYDTNDAYRFSEHVNIFGLAAFDVLPPDIQLYVLRQYCAVFTTP